MGRLKPRNRQRGYLSNRMKLIIGASVFLFAFVTIFIAIKLSDVEDSSAFVEGDYRTSGSGTFTDESIWEQYDGDDWLPADQAPSEKGSVIIIDSGHVVIMEEEIIASKFIIENGASVELLCNSVKIEKYKGDGYLKCEGSIDFGDCIIEGNADFITTGAARLAFGTPEGLDKTHSRGNIQLKGKYDLSDQTHFVFNGLVAQETGNGFPSTVTRLTIDNPEGVTLSGPVTIIKKLDLLSGALITGPFGVTLGEKPESLIDFNVVNGSVVGELTLPVEIKNTMPIQFPVSDGTGRIVLSMLIEDKKFKDGFLTVKYYEGSIENDNRSPFAAKEYVVAIMENGYYTAVANQGLKDAAFKTAGVKYLENGTVIVNWNLLDYRTISDVDKQKDGNSASLLKNIFCGPTPFEGSFYIRFDSEIKCKVMIDLVSSGGKTVHHEVIEVIEGFNNWKFNEKSPLEPGNYFLRISNSNEIHSLLVTRAGAAG